jgi:hypothetical protein
VLSAADITPGWSSLQLDLFIKLVDSIMTQMRPKSPPPLASFQPLRIGQRRRGFRPHLGHDAVHQLDKQIQLQGIAAG